MNKKTILTNNSINQNSLKITKISVVILTFNSEKSIEKTLKSVKNFSEVIIFDGNSTDKTVNICNSFSNTKIFQGDFQGFGKTKNIAVSKASNNWIFNLDSDEYISNELFLEISNLELENQYTCYKLKRDNFVFGKKMRFSGVGNDWLIRIFNKNTHKFKNLEIHEFVETAKYSDIKKLKNSFSHSAVNNISDILCKTAKYSQMGTKPKIPLFLILVKSFFAFFRSYFFKLGFLDGWRGLLIAVSNANGRFYKYISRYI